MSSAAFQKFPWHLRLYTNLLLVCGNLGFVAVIVLWISGGSMRLSRALAPLATAWTAWGLRKGDREELLWLIGFTCSSAGS